MTGAELLSLARAYVSDYLAALEVFVNLDSGTHDVSAVQEAGEFAAAQHEAAGAEVEWVRSPDPAIADTYIARWNGDATPRVVMLGHHDTVYGLGTTRERPFRIVDERAYGPGVMDMKGGVLLGAFAMRLLREGGAGPLPNVVFVGNPDEEIGSPTSRRIIEREASGANLVLVLEPGREAGSIQTTRKGVGMYEMIVEGRSAHAGARPQDGRSAVLELAHKTIALHALTDFVRGTTVNVGVVNGGSRRNVVPDQATALIDLRASTADQAIRADAAIRAIAERNVVEGTNTTLSGGMNRPPMEKHPGTERALEVSRSIVAEVGSRFEEVSSGGGSDGNFTAPLGVPTLDGLGPVGRNAHSPDEWLDITSLPERLALVAGLILRAGS
jgi:glutamate carboxypeptidase